MKRLIALFLAQCCALCPFAIPVSATAPDQTAGNWSGTVAIYSVSAPHTLEEMAPLVETLHQRFAIKGYDASVNQLNATDIKVKIYDQYVTEELLKPFGSLGKITVFDGHTRQLVLESPDLQLHLDTSAQKLYLHLIGDGPEKIAKKIC